MPETIHAKIWVSTHKLPSGNYFTIPFTHPGIIWMNSAHVKLAKKFAAYLEKEYCTSGEYLELLRLLPQLEFEHIKVSVVLQPATKEPNPPVDLHFDMFQTNPAPNLFLGFVPVLNLTSKGNTPEELLSAMQGNIRLFHSRTYAAGDINKIFSTQGFNDLDFRPLDLALKTYSLKELKNLRRDETNKMLPRVAAKMIQQQPAAWFLDEYVEKVSDALSGRFRRSVLVTGRPGVGKSALIKEVIYRNSAATDEKSRLSVWETNASFFINKLIGQTGWEENLKRVCDELRELEDVLYFENLADLFEAGQYEGSDKSIGDALLEYIKRGDITLISECTAEELAAIELRVPGYSAHFYVLRLEEPPYRDLLKIIHLHINEKLRTQSNILVDEGAVETALQLQKRFAPYSGFPGKTIRFFENLMNETENTGQIVTSNEVYANFCNETGMPRMLIDSDYPFSFDEMEAHFSTNIFGQDEAVQVVVDMIATVKAGLVRLGKPIASLLFIGPTGVGKTELAKVLAEYIFHSRKRVIRFDMSEFSDISQVLRLTGGIYNNHGLLVDAVRQDPFSVILFDELEKAHPAFYDLLLQILGEGRLTDSRGNVADFCSTIIIMTSNIGAASIKYSVSGFSKQQENTGRVISHFRKEVQKYFRPELFNRLDRIVGFSPLSREAIRKVVDREIGLLKRREGLLYRNIDLDITTAALDKIGSDGYDKSYGARQLQRTIRAELVIPLAKALNKYDQEKPLIVDVSVENERFTIKVSEKIIPKNEPKPTTANPALIELINVLTTSRRKLQLVTNSPNVQGLLSQLDILNRTKRKLGEVFYKDHRQVSEFFWLENINNKLTELSERINNMEKLALEVYFDLAPKQQISQSDYTKWETDFMTLKMEIIYPGRNLQTLILAIYGSLTGLEQLYGLYKYLCQKRGFKTKTWLVYMLHDKKSKKLFKHKERDDAEKALTEAEKLNLVGIEMEVTGEAVDIYLKPEEGITEFEIKGEKERCKVIVDTNKADKYKTPENIIRKQAYEGTTQFPIRRTITANSLKDKLYKMGIPDLREMPAEIAEYLDARFEEQVLEAVCNGREGK